MNKVILLGRLTGDVDARYSADSTCIAKYTLAVDRKYKKDSADTQTADFIRCVAFDKNGEFAEKYFRKGTKIAVVGRIQTGSYKDKEGKTVYTTDVVIEEQNFAESKSASDSSAQSRPEPSAKADSDGFMNIPDGLQEELPFM